MTYKIEYTIYKYIQYNIVSRTAVQHSLDCFGFGGALYRNLPVSNTDEIAMTLIRVEGCAEMVNKKNKETAPK